MAVLFCFRYIVSSSATRNFFIAVVGVPCEGIFEGTIIEDAEDESGQSVPTRVTKSPSLPLNKSNTLE